MIDWDAPTLPESSRIPTGPERTGVDWFSPRWGKDGHNVHLSENGSDVPDRHGDVRREHRDARRARRLLCNR